MADDANTRRDAAADIQAEGVQVTWTTVTGYTDDPSAGTRTPTTSTLSPYAVVTEYSTQDMDGTLVQAGDRKLLMEAQTFADAGVTPTDDDKVSVSSREYQVVRLSPLEPAGVPLLYNVQVRGV